MHVMSKVLSKEHSIKWDASWHHVQYDNTFLYYHEFYVTFCLDVWATLSTWHRKLLSVHSWMAGMGLRDLEATTPAMWMSSTFQALMNHLSGEPLLGLCLCICKL